MHTLYIHIYHIYKYITCKLGIRKVERTCVKIEGDHLGIFWKLQIIKKVGVHCFFIIKKNSTLKRVKIKGHIVVKESNVSTEYKWKTGIAVVGATL